VDNITYFNSCIHSTKGDETLMYFSSIDELEGLSDG
jgi:hypothetical protein